MNMHQKISYIELPAKNIPANKAFFSQVFSWSFVDYGKEYTAFTDGTMEGGFFTSPLSSTTQNGGALIVFYSEDLEVTQQLIENAGGKIIQNIFSFPGGRRFHFIDPSDNEYAVWSNTVSVQSMDT